MCGITGFFTPGFVDEVELRARVCRMADQLVHRGPDDSGVCVDPLAGVALGFRRLAILDLSPAGHQPMQSASGRLVIVFNGEVYNFGDLRAELESKGHKFRGHSDTEVMLAAFSEWGLEPAVKRFVGMFAFALWDRTERALHLVRDRLGIKPLYYGWANNTFLFGSELKALRAHPDFVPDVNRDALALQMRHNYITQPHSIYKGIYKLPPGCILTLKAGSTPTTGRPTPVAYWSAQEVWKHGMQELFKGSEQDAVDQLEGLLRESVRLRLISDVPLGAFLSGGIDSSVVVALMQAQSNRPVKTFTIGFCEDEYNEAKDAKKVAAHLGTDHTELYVTPEEAQAVIQKLPTLYDEPFSDSSQIPTYLISELTRRQVTVSLSGDGGDELFGGYDRYFLARELWKWSGWLPAPSRRLIARMLTFWDVRTYDRYLGRFKFLRGSRKRPGTVGHRLHRLAEVFARKSPQALYHRLLSHWKETEKIVLGAHEPGTILSDDKLAADMPEFSSRMMFLDLVTYLPDDILTKVDRASMGVSLEARVPILDHRVVEFAACLPVSLKVRQGMSKWVLRQVLYKYVPRELVERPKMGFGIPVGLWLRGPLREWAEDLLNETRLNREGYLASEPIRRIWAEHLTGTRNWQYLLWDVLMFQAWRAQWM